MEKENEAIPIKEADVKFIGDLVLQNEVIPIIGYDLIYISNAGGERQEFIKTVIENIDDPSLQNVCSNFVNKYPHAPTIELLNYAYHLFDIRQKRRFNLAFSRAINKVRAESPVFLDPFIKLARIRNFKLYVNATCTNVPEIAINAYRSREKKDGYEVYSSLRPDGKDLPTPARNTLQDQHPLNGIKKPTIYNLFGTHNTDSRYLLTDVEYIDLLVELLNKDCFCPNFKSYLSQSSLLFIGCNFSEWFLRFFTRFWAGPQMDENLAKQYNVLIDSLNQGESTDRAFFLSNFKIKALGGNSIEFIDALYKYIGNNSQGDENDGDDQSPGPNTPHGSPSKPGSSIVEDIFNNYVMISYNSLDKDVAIKIRDILTANNIRVWMDLEQLNTGDDLDEKISKQIETSSMVILVVSENFQKRKDEDPYFLREWKLIINQNKNRMSFFIDDVNDTSIVPESLKKYRDTIKEITNLEKLVAKFDILNPAIPENTISRIREVQYQSLVKGLKFKQI